MAELCTLPLGHQCIARVPVYGESGSATDDDLYSCFFLLCIDGQGDQNARGFYDAN